VTPPDDGRIYLFDTSIWSHTEHPRIASDWAALLRSDRIAVSPVVEAKSSTSRVGGSPPPKSLQRLTAQAGAGTTAGSAGSRREAQRG